jgi:Mg2+-importing ATPase
VDEEQVARPRPWNIDEIKRFILFIGPISSIFDYTTFFVMLWVFHCWDPSRASVFQTGLVRRVADDADAHHPRHSHQ